MKERKNSKTELATVLPKFNMKKERKEGKVVIFSFPMPLGRGMKRMKNMNLILNATFREIAI